MIGPAAFGLRFREIKRPVNNDPQSVCMCVRNIRVTGCESCTSLISTNPGSMEAGEYGLTRGTRFVVSCLEVVCGRWADAGFVV